MTKEDAIKEVAEKRALLIAAKESGNLEEAHNLAMQIFKIMADAIRANKNK